ncbi:hypothetical protein TNCV_1231931 [Trichonephila clavipes]|nr:hypothetical protein TNCV_1231931 [Trichonephila clavipes]
MEYSDVNKRRVASKFADKSTEKAAYGTEHFKRDTLIVALDKLILDLNRRSQVYAEYSKIFKFLDLQDQKSFVVTSVKNTWIFEIEGCLCKIL